ESGAQDWLTEVTYSFGAGSIGARIETKQSPWGVEIGEWVLSRKWNEYDHEVTRVRPPRTVRTQKTVLRDGKVGMAVTDGKTMLRSPPAAGPLFVPGGAMPLLLGKLPFEAMVLESEATPAPGEAAATMPMLLVLEP